MIAEGGPPEAAQDLQRAVDAAGTSLLRLATPSGQLLPLPEPVERALRATIAILAAGDSVAVVAVGRQLSTSQAARLLDVSRPHLITLLERGEVPHRRIGTHRRLRLVDVLAYKVRRDQEVREHLDAILAEAQESDGYF